MPTITSKDTSSQNDRPTAWAASDDGQLGVARAPSELEEDAPYAVLIGLRCELCI